MQGWEAQPLHIPPSPPQRVTGNDCILMWLLLPVGPQCSDAVSSRVAVLTEATRTGKATNHTYAVSRFPSRCIIAVSGWRRSSVLHALLQG